MISLTEIHKKMTDELGRGAPELLAFTNIDDVIWYAKSKGIKKLQVNYPQMRLIFSFFLHNIPMETPERKQLLTEGSVDRILGIDLECID